MSEFPSDWSRTTFGNVLNQRKESGFTNEELLAVTSSLGIVKRDTLERRDTSNEDKSKYLLVTEGDIAYNTMRMWQGVSGVSRFRGIVSPAYTICTPTERLDAGFAGYLLKDPEMVSVFRQRSQGLVSDTWNLKYESFAQIPCVIPPLPEQKKIAEILSGIDKAIEKLLLLSSKNKYLAKAIQEKAELRTGSGRKEKLHDVCELITKGATPTTYGHKLLSSRFPDAVSFLGGGNASPEGYFVHGSERFCTSDATQSLRRSALKERDTLVTIVGYVGNTCLIPPEILPANINQNVALVRADANHLESEYLNLFLRTEGGRRLAQIATTQAQPSVSLKQVGDLEIYLPPIEEQVLATKQADAFCKINIQLGKKLHALQELKSAMASDLLSGRKRVSI